MRGLSLLGRRPFTRLFFSLMERGVARRRAERRGALRLARIDSNAIFRAAAVALTAYAGTRSGAPMTEVDPPRLTDLLSDAAAAPTWSGLRARWQREGIWDRIDPALRDRLLAAWRTAAARRLSDRDLMDDLRHWADGGDFKAHLNGYNAPDPASLVAAAAARGWFVRPLGPDRWVVNPPENRPLTLSGVHPRSAGRDAWGADVEQRERPDDGSS